MKIIDLIHVKNVFNTDAEISDIKTAYKIVKFIKAIETETSFYQESMNNIINKYAEKDENNRVVVDKEGNYSIPNCNIELYIDEINQLNNLEVDKPNCVFTIEELKDLKISLSGLYMLDPFIVEG